MTSPGPEGSPTPPRRRRRGGEVETTEPTANFAAFQEKLHTDDPAEQINWTDGSERERIADVLADELNEYTSADDVAENIAAITAAIVSANVLRKSANTKSADDKVNRLYLETARSMLGPDAESKKVRGLRRLIATMDEIPDEFLLQGPAGENGILGTLDENRTSSSETFTAGTLDAEDAFSSLDPADKARLEAARTAYTDAKAHRDKPRLRRKNRRNAEEALADPKTEYEAALAEAFTALEASITNGNKDARLKLAAQIEAINVSDQVYEKVRGESRTVRTAERIGSSRTRRALVLGATVLVSVGAGVAAGPAGLAVVGAARMPMLLANNLTGQYGTRNLPSLNVDHGPVGLGFTDSADYAAVIIESNDKLTEQSDKAMKKALAKTAGTMALTAAGGGYGIRAALGIDYLDVLHFVSGGGMGGHAASSAELPTGHGGGAQLEPAGGEGAGAGQLEPAGGGQTGAENQLAPAGGGGGEGQLAPADAGGAPAGGDQLAPAGTGTPEGAGAPPVELPQTGGDTVTVGSGDSLSKIAAAQLGPDATPDQIAEATNQLYQANADIIGNNPNIIQPGMQLNTSSIDVKGIMGLDSTPGAGGGSIPVEVNGSGAASIDLDVPRVQEAFSIPPGGGMADVLNHLGVPSGQELGVLSQIQDELLNHPNPQVSEIFIPNINGSNYIGIRPVGSLSPEVQTAISEVMAKHGFLNRYALAA